MRTFFSGLLVIMSLLFSAGCGPEVPDEELGTIIFQKEKLPHASDPYLMPDQLLEDPRPPGESEAEDHSAHAHSQPSSKPESPPEATPTGGEPSAEGEGRKGAVEKSEGGNPVDIPPGGDGESPSK